MKAQVLGNLRKHVAREPLLAQTDDIFYSSIALHMQPLHSVVALCLFPARRTRLAQV